MRSETIKVRVLTALLALTVCASVLFAGGALSPACADSAPVTATVTFRASYPGGFDVVDKKITASSDLAEKYFPAIAGNEPEGQVSFADVLVAAHIKKYGESGVAANLSMENSSYGTSMKKQFGHEAVGMYYVDNKALSKGVSDPVTDGQTLAAGTYVNSWNDLYGYFDQASYTGTAGKAIMVRVNADNWGTPLAPQDLKIYAVDSQGQLAELPAKASADKDGQVSLTFQKAGTYAISATGSVNVYGKGGISAPFAVVTVKAAEKPAAPDKPVKPSKPKTNPSQSSGKAKTVKTTPAQASAAKTSSVKTEASQDAPATGDETMIGLWVLLLVTGCAGLLTVRLYMRKR